MKYPRCHHVMDFYSNRAMIYNFFFFFFVPCLEASVSSLLPMVENLLFIVTAPSHNKIINI